MKANFILRPHNAKLFVSRLQAIIGITGVVVSQSEYTGARDRNSILKRRNIKLTFAPVVQTCPHYIDEDTVQIEAYPVQVCGIGNGDGIIIRPNDDTCITYKWGQKFRITSNRIYTVGRINLPSYTGGSRTTIKPFYDMAKAKDANAWANRTSEIYWRDVEEEYLRNGP